MMKKKKYLLIGVMAFFLIAIISTTFATFVITGGNKTANINGPTISVGDIKNNVVDLAGPTLIDSTITIDAEPSDEEGIVSAQDSALDLEIKVSIQITGSKDNWSSVTITPLFTNNQYNKNGINGDLLALEVNPISKDEFTGGEESGIWTCEKTLSFTFGSATNEENPSVYFDSPDWTGSKNPGDIYTYLNDLLQAYKQITVSLGFEVK